MKKIVILATAAFLTTSCQAIQERNEKKADEIATKRCVEIGFKPETDKFMDCKLQMRSVLAQEMGARAAAYSASLKAGSYARGY